MSDSLSYRGRVVSPTRAKPLPPLERRAALIAAAVPLVRQYGTKVSTRQLAEASGVAEGTIFRVFPDKDSLIKAAVEAALDPRPLLAELTAVDPALPLRPRLLAITTILQHRLIDVMGLMTALRMQGPPTDEKTRLDNSARINKIVTKYLEPDRAQLRLTPADTVRMLRLLLFAGSHPLISEGRLLTPDEIVTQLLDGALARPGKAGKD